MMPDEPMQEGSKRKLIMRILPVDVAKHLALQPRTKNTAELVDKISGHLTDMGSFEASQGNSPMDLCELNVEQGSGTPDPGDKIAKMQAQIEQLSAFVKASPPPGIGGKGSREPA